MEASCITGFSTLVTCTARRRHPPPRQASTNKQELGWQELHRAAQIAAWSGLCYLMPGELPAAIEQQHKGNLTLLASGRNEYTAW
jgi:hypothetical protein